jgi:hypothetical protein
MTLGGRRVEVSRPGVRTADDEHEGIRRAIKDVFGEHALVHRRHRHKERTIPDLLPERERPLFVGHFRGPRGAS